MYFTPFANCVDVFLQYAYCDQIFRREEKMAFFSYRGFCHAVCILRDFVNCVEHIQLHTRHMRHDSTHSHSAFDRERRVRRNASGLSELHLLDSAHIVVHPQSDSLSQANEMIYKSRMAALDNNSNNTISKRKITYSKIQLVIFFEVSSVRSSCHSPN